MSYRILRQSLAVAIAQPLQMLDPGSEVYALHVLAVPDGAAPQLRLGPAAESIPVFAGYHAELCGADVRSGLFVTNTQLASGELVVQVWTDGPSSSGGPR